MVQAGSDTIDVLLVDDHAMFREGLARLLERDPGFRVVGQCGSSDEALPLIRKNNPALVLLDVDLGSERALDLIGKAHNRGYDGKILIVTAGLSGQEAVHLIQSGVAGIIHKHHTGDMLSVAIRKVMAGEVFLEEDYLGSLFRSVDRTRVQQKPRLTDRERTVLRFIFQGLTNKEIGQNLQISEGAVKASIRQLFEKSGARTRAQLVKIALEQYRDQL